jgi:DNA topoisomerase-1
MSPVAVPALQHRSAEELDIRRVKRGKGFSYQDAGGSKVTDSATLDRIKAIVIPPAWTDVRISDDPDSHLQAVGRDARGRLQYRYHPDWTTFRDRVKFDHLPAFANALPSVRKRIDADLALPGVPRDKVLATVVELLQTTLIRVGNEEYARDNGAYGLTTFRNRHAKVSGSEIAFVFTGKSGITHEVRARDRRVAKVLRECQEIRGQRLFQYLDDDGAPTPVHSHDVNDYLREIADADITAKDFRTWVATVATASALGPLDPPTSQKDEKAIVKAVIEEVAADLGNTPTVCRASYVHPRVLETFPTGQLHDVWSSTPPRKARLTREERRTQALLGRRIRAKSEQTVAKAAKTQKKALRRAS